jgi:hypothetical protein
MSIGPAVLSILMALVGGSGLRTSWLAPAFPLLAILVISWLSARLDERVMKRLGVVALLIAVALPIAYAVVVPRVGHLGSSKPLRVNWPQKEIARTLSAAWTAETGRPLKIVAGSSWLAGLVGINHSDRPSILTEGVLAYSPWITRERLRREGALAAWVEGRESTTMPALEALIAGRQIKEVRVAFPRSNAPEALVIKYVVLNPE